MYKPASVAQLDAHQTGDRRLQVRPPPGRQHSFMKIMKFFSTTILSLPLFIKGSCQFLVKECQQYWLTA